MQINPTSPSPSLSLSLCAVCAGQLRALRKEAGQLTGEKAALQREVNKLRAEVSSLVLAGVSPLVLVDVTIVPGVLRTKDCRSNSRRWKAS